MQETLPHAVQRMRSQGFNDHQIAGQIHQWHASWTPDQITAVLHAPAHVTEAKPTYHGTSTRPFFPGQKPDHYMGSRGPGSTGIPIYVLGKKQPSAPALTTLLGAPAAGQSEAQSQAALGRIYKQNHPVGQQVIGGVGKLVASFVPGDVIGQGIIDGHVGLGTVGNEVLNDLPLVGKGAALFGGFRALRRARETATTIEDVAKTAKAAGEAVQATEKPVAAAAPAVRPQMPKGTLFHGSPEGDIGRVDPLWHTKMWREGQGFYLTSDPAKAAKYAAGKTARGERRAAAAETGRVNAFRLKPGAKVLNMDAQPESFWRDLASKVTGEPVDEKTWKLWASDVAPGKGISKGVLNRQRVMNMATGWADLPHTDAYYALEDVLAEAGYQATKHTENGVPVFIIKDANAIEHMGAVPKSVAAPPAKALAPTATQMPAEAANVAGDVGKTTKVATRIPAEAAQLRAALSGKAAKDAFKELGPYGQTGAKMDDPLLGTSAKTAYKAESVLRTEERAARLTKANEHLANKSIDPTERIRLWKEEMKGELPKVNWRGFDTLDANAVKAMTRYALDEAPHLLGTQRVRVVTTLENAVNGIAPRPHELKLLEHVFGKDETKGFMQLPTHPLREAIVGTLNIPRTLMASMDFSAPLRQGLVVGTRHPIVTGKNFPAMFKAFGSEHFYQALGEEIKARPTFPLMLEAELPLTGLDRGVGQAEEAFAGQNIAEKFTGGKRFSPVRMSDRAYTAFLDKTRADVFDVLIRQAQSQGRNVQDEKFLHDLGHFIGNATGRGTFDHQALEQAMPLLNIALFSPRLIASRLQMLNPANYLLPTRFGGLDPFVRRQMLTSALSTFGSILTVLGLAKAAGATVGMNPRSSDFGKIKIGDTRIDIAGGFQPYFHLLGELVTGERMSSTTGKVTSLRHPKYGQQSLLDALVSFGRGKLAPLPSIGADIAAGSAGPGQALTTRNEIKNHFLPLIWQDAKALYDQPFHGMNGIEAALAGYAVEMFGTGLQTYQPQPSKGNTGSSDPFDSSPGGSSGDPFDSAPGGSSGDPFDSRP